MMPRSRIAMLFLGAAALLSGCSSLNPFSSDKPKPAELVDFQPSTSLGTLWSARVGAGGGYQFQPAVAGNSVFAAGHNGEVAHFRDGQALWSVNVGKRLAAGVGSDGRLVAVVAVDGEVIALDADSGAERWRAPAGAEVLAPPAVADSAVIVRASDSRLLAFDVRSGERRWTYQRTTPPLALRSVAGILLADRVAIVGYPGGKLVGVNIDNGGAMFDLTVSSPRGVTELERITDVAGTAVLGRREICAVSYQGRAGCFDSTNGTALWLRDFSSTVGMDKDTRRAVITDDKDAVRGLDAFSGADVWKQEALARRGVTRPLLVGDHVVVADGEGYVHVLAAEDGAFAARARPDGSAVVVAPQRLGADSFVIQTRDGGVFALEAR